MTKRRGSISITRRLSLHHLRRMVAIFTTHEERRALYRDNNTRNVCLYNLLKKTGRLFSIERINVDMVNPDVGEAYDPENIMLKLQEYGVKNHDELVALIEKMEADEDLE
jgi:hypothetical protein